MKFVGRLAWTRLESKEGSGKCWGNTKMVIFWFGCLKSLGLSSTKLCCHWKYLKTFTKEVAFWSKRQENGCFVLKALNTADKETQSRFGLFDPRIQKHCWFESSYAYFGFAHKELWLANTPAWLRRHHSHSMWTSSMEKSNKTATAQRTRRREIKIRLMFYLKESEAQQKCIKIWNISLTDFFTRFALFFHAFSGSDNVHSSSDGSRF